MSNLEIFLISLSFTFLLVYQVWIYAVKIENFSIIDAAWSSGFFIQALLFLSLAQGYLPRKLLFFAIITAWSLRLAYFLTMRIYRHHPKEDTRYLQLREQYGADYRKRFLGFFMLQAVSISVLTFPFIFVFNNSSDSIGLPEIAGLVCFLISIVGEALADHQMARFKSNPQNQGKVCDVGLWKYSRHPNYFFESCIWFSFFIFMLGTPGLVWAIYVLLIILFLLLKVTGVPPSEAQSLKSRGEAYRNYQKKTSVFVPWRIK